MSLPFIWLYLCPDNFARAFDNWKSERSVLQARLQAVHSYDIFHYGSDPSCTTQELQDILELRKMPTNPQKRTGVDSCCSGSPPW